MTHLDTESEFNQRFKGRFIALFGGKRRDWSAIHAALMDMVEFIGRGQGFRDECSRDDITHGVFTFAAEKAKEERWRSADTAASWLRTSINREFWRLIESESDIRRNSSAMVTESENQSRRVESFDPWRAGRQARTKLPPMDDRQQRAITKWFDRHIEKLVDQMENATTDTQRHWLDGMLQGLQESRRYCVSKFKPCETDMVKFTKDQRLSKVSA